MGINRVALEAKVVAFMNDGHFDGRIGPKEMKELRDDAKGV
jgi:hypothetical protein